MLDKPIRAALVSVGYADILSITLPINRCWFSEVLIVTTESDTDTKQLSEEHNCFCYLTNSFYDDGAYFNKWKALEKGLDAFGRHGWICLLDADIIWPDISRYQTTYLEEGKLYGPMRRILSNITKPISIPQEKDWKKLSLHNTKEFCGWTQIFHASDPVLSRNGPWHQVDWKHAGGADSYFHMLWSEEDKIRLPWEVLHLGEPGRNWCGMDNQEAMQELVNSRRRRESSWSNEWKPERIGRN